MYSFRGALSSLDPVDLVRADTRLRALCDHLASTQGLKKAESLVVRLLVGALDDFGEHLVGGKSAVLQKVLRLREELGDTLADAIENPTAKSFSAADVARKFDELDGALAELAKPAGKASKEKFPKPKLEAAKKEVQDAAARPDIDKPKPLKGQALTDFHARLASQEFKRLPNGRYARRYANGFIEVHVENGRFRVKALDTDGRVVAEFGEFSVQSRYSDRARSSRVLQAHHGCQNAIMKQLFRRFGYSGDDAPTIWLRNSTFESPHGTVTHSFQNPTLAQRKKRNGADYGRLRDWARQELAHVGASHAEIEAYLAMMDKYMRDSVFSSKKWQDLPAAEKRRLLGSFEP